MERLLDRISAPAHAALPQGAGGLPIPSDRPHHHRSGSSPGILNHDPARRGPHRISLRPLQSVRKGDSRGVSSGASVRADGPGGAGQGLRAPSTLPGGGAPGGRHADSLPTSGREPVMSSGRWLPAALGAVLGCALLPPAAAAASLPDWAMALAGVPEAPSGPTDTPSRVLYSEVRVTVQPVGTRRTRRRFALQALSVVTDKVSTGWYQFDDTAKMTGVRAWHMPLHERAKKSRSTPIDIAVGDAFLSGSKALFLEVQGVE